MAISKALGLRLPPSLKKSVLRAVKSACEFSDEPYSESDGLSLADATIVAGEIAESIGVNIEDALDALHKKFAQSLKRRPSKDAIAELRRYMPGWEPDSSDQSERSPRYRIAAFEQLVLEALCARETESTILAARTKKYRVAEFIAHWPWAEQDWWQTINKTLGSDRSRLFLTGLLRHFLTKPSKSGSLGKWEASILDALEEYSLTGERTRNVEKFTNRSLKWKYNLRHLEGAAIILLNYRVIDGLCMGEALGNIANHAQWNPLKALTEARTWYHSLVPKVKKPALKKTWVTEPILQLANEMNEDRKFSQFPKLGKLLEQAGCKNSVILNHCSDSKQPHMLGDWLLVELSAYE